MHRPANFVWNAKLGKMVKVPHKGQPFILNAQTPSKWSTIARRTS